MNFNPNTSGLKRTAGPGRPRLTPEQKALAAQERAALTHFERQLKKLLPKTVNSLKEAIKCNQKSTRALTKDGELVELDPTPGHHQAAIHASSLIQDRILGKPRENIEHSGLVNLMAVRIVHEDDLQAEPFKQLDYKDNTT